MTLDFNRKSKNIQAWNLKSEHFFFYYFFMFFLATAVTWSYRCITVSLKQPANFQVIIIMALIVFTSFG